MPRKVRLTAGPSTLSMARGTASSSHVAKVIAKALEHSGEPGAPRSRKSFR